MRQKATIFLLSLSLVAAFGHAEEQPVPVPTQLEALDTELDTLRAELHEVRLKAMREEINSQPLMFEEWSEYAQGMKTTESLGDQARNIQQRIDMLETKRQQLVEEKAPEASKS